jgi:probable F420-dependent oxidoreductase
LLTGIAIPTCKEGLSSPVGFASPNQVMEIIRRAEELGYHSVWGNDHITPPKYVRETFEDPPNFYEPLTVLSVAAPQTSRIRLATGVAVLTMREPVYLAKTVATLDQFCGGRVILGVGIGSFREEFERLFPRLRRAQRGEIADECLAILKLLFEERRASFKGKFFEFEGIELAPKPLQHPFPIFVGGNNLNVVRRAVRYGQGWLPASIDLEGIRAGVETLRREAEAAGRDPADIQVAPQLMCAIAPTHEQALEKFRKSWMYRHLVELGQSTLRQQDTSRLEEMNLVGSPQVLKEKLHRLREAGVTMLAATNFVGATPQEWLEDMQFFAEEVLD